MRNCFFIYINKKTSAIYACKNFSLKVFQNLFLIMYENYIYTAPNKA